MDDQQVIILEDELNKPVSELTRKFYNDILNAMDARAKQAKMQLDEVQVMLVELAGIVNPDWMFEQRVTKMRDTQKIRIDELVPVVKKAAKEAHIAMLKAKAALTDISNLKAEIESLRLELQSARTEIDYLGSVSDQDNQMIEDLKKKLAQLTENGTSISKEDRVIAQTIITGEFDQGFATFEKSKLRDRLEFLIGCVGDRGQALSSDLGRIIAEEYSLADRSGSVTDLFDEAENLWIISFSTTDTRQAGVKPKIVNLTRLGEYIYEKLFGKKPKKIDHAKEHKTEAHGALIMRSKELLRRIGYEILEDVEIKQRHSHTFQPDITARKDGHTIYVEVEREGTKGNQDSQAKIQNFRDFANGEVYFFCENSRVTQATRRTINAKISRREGDVFRICDVSKTAKTATSEKEIWTVTLKF